LKIIRQSQPGYNDRSILKKYLPIDDAIKQGEDSELYQRTALVLKCITKKLGYPPYRLEIMNDITVNNRFRRNTQTGAQRIAVSVPLPGLDYYDNIRDRNSDGNLIPHEGSFGKYPDDFEDE
jgi:hypothetical protein